MRLIFSQLTQATRFLLERMDWSKSFLIELRPGVLNESIRYSAFMAISHPYTLYLCACLVVCSVPVWPSALVPLLNAGDPGRSFFARPIYAHAKLLHYGCLLLRIPARLPPLSHCILPFLTPTCPHPIHIQPNLSIHSSILSSSLLFTCSHTLLPSLLSSLNLVPPYSPTDS